jgi:hypothetical protein
LEAAADKVHAEVSMGLHRRLCRQEKELAGHPQVNEEGESVP